jgi:hypothetical protein
MRVLDLLAIIPLSVFSCNYSTIGFIDTLCYSLVNVDTLYYFNTVGIIFLALFLI